MSTNQTRLGWADALRVCAMLAVVMLHCAGATLGAQVPGSTRFWVLNLLDGGTQWGVPVFIMLSGMFFLDPDKPLPTRKWLSHVGRLALLTLFWGLAYALYDARAAHFGLEWLLEAVISLSTARLHYHLWFLPMLLGLYLLIPPMRALVRGASRRCLWYTVGLWAVVTVCLNTLFSLFPGIFGHDWLTALNLYHLSGFGGYFLLGYLLRTCELRRRNTLLLYVGGALGLAVTWWGTAARSAAAGAPDLALYGKLTPNVAVTAAALFLLFRQLDVGRHPLWGKVSALSLGVYALHPLVLDALTRLRLPPDSWNLALAVPVRWLTVSLLTLAAAWLLHRIPKVGKLIA